MCFLVFWILPNLVPFSFTANYLTQFSLLMQKSWKQYHKIQKISMDCDSSIVAINAICLFFLIKKKHLVLNSINYFAYWISLTFNTLDLFENMFIFVYKTNGKLLMIFVLKHIKISVNMYVFFYIYNKGRNN